MRFPIQKGQQGPDVRRLQELLTLKGYPVTVDGDFGKNTYKAVRAFQSQNLDQHGTPLQVDGRVGPLTWWSLNNPKPELHPLSAVQWDMMPPESAGGSTIGRTALSFAIAELRAGAREIGANNSGPWVRKYLAPAGLEVGNSWCAAFVSWCFLQAAGNDPSKMPFKYDPGARSIRRQFAKRGQTASPSDSYVPLPGDLVVWWRESPDSWKGHIGIVHQVKDGMLYTIEGNRSPLVQGFSYVATDVEKLLGICKVVD